MSSAYCVKLAGCQMRILREMDFDYFCAINGRVLVVFSGFPTTSFGTLIQKFTCTCRGCCLVCFCLSCLAGMVVQYWLIGRS